MTSVLCRDASLKVQHRLRNEQGDNRTVEEIWLLTDDDAVNRNVSIQYKIKIIPPVSLLQTQLTMRVISARSFGSLTKKYTTFTFSPFTARSKAGGRSVELERVAVIACLAPSTWPSKAIISQLISAMDTHACTSRLFCLDLIEIAQWPATVSVHYSYLQAPQRDRSAVALFFFFLLSIAQRIGSKPPPSHMKVLSFVRDVRTFEMTPKGRGMSKTFQVFFRFCWTWTKRYLITSQARVEHVSRIHHRTILRLAARIRLPYLFLSRSLLRLPFFLKTKIKNVTRPYVGVLLSTTSTNCTSSLAA